jgi:hypothetical protein
MNHQKTIEKLKQAGFPSKCLERLQNMQRGDDNNKKGAFYERMFTFYRILQETEKLLNVEQSPINSDILFSNAELAFVDDLCITFSEKKERYQLKNSPTAGKADKLHEVFDDQKRMDECLQQPAQSFLVCSDEKTVNDNNDDGRIASQYFPAYTTSMEYAREMAQLLHCVCLDDSQHDTALRLLGAGAGEAQSLHKPLRQIWHDVLQCAHPNIFYFDKTEGYPPLFEACCTKCGITLAAATISYKGFSIMITPEMRTKIADEDWSNLADARQVLERLQVLAFTVEAS